MRHLGKILKLCEFLSMPEPEGQGSRLHSSSSGVESVLASEVLDCVSLALKWVSNLKGLRAEMQ